jgi:hypothetical protein
LRHAKVNARTNVLAHGYEAVRKDDTSPPTTSLVRAKITSGKPASPWAWLAILGMMRAMRAFLATHGRKDRTCLATMTST